MMLTSYALMGHGVQPAGQQLPTCSWLTLCTCLAVRLLPLLPMTKMREPLSSVLVSAALRALAAGESSPSRFLGEDGLVAGRRPLSGLPTEKLVLLVPYSMGRLPVLLLGGRCCIALTVLACEEVRARVGSEEASWGLGRISEERPHPDCSGLTGVLPVLGAGSGGCRAAASGLENVETDLASGMVRVCSRPQGEVTQMSLAHTSRASCAANLDCSGHCCAPARHSCLHPEQKYILQKPGTYLCWPPKARATAADHHH